MLTPSKPNQISLRALAVGEPWLQVKLNNQKLKRKTITRRLLCRRIACNILQDCAVVKQVTCMTPSKRKYTYLISCFPLLSVSVFPPDLSMSDSLGVAYKCRSTLFSKQEGFTSCQR